MSPKIYLGLINMKVTLQHYTPLLFCANAIRTCWQSFDKSDEGGEKDKELIDRIRNAVVFISAAGMNPIFLQTFVKGQDIIQNQLKKLRENLEFVYGGDNLSEQFYYDPDYPVIYSHSNVIFEYLKSKGIIITNFKYPNYEALMNRIVITANHTKQDLEQLKSALRLFQKETLH